MARTCDLCAKRNDAGNNRPWSKKATRRVRKVNTQKFTVDTPGNKVRLRICNGCRRTLAKPPRIRKADRLAAEAVAAASAE